MNPLKSYTHLNWQGVFGQRKEGPIMISQSEFYEKNLYPLQDGVLNVLNQSDTNFFLTGGTALSRAYYNHRYSDDLDFFITQSRDYDDELNAILSLLREAGFSWDTEKDFIRNKDFATIKVGFNEYNRILKEK